MKGIFIALLVMFYPMMALTQDYGVFADAGASLARGKAGFSAAYNYYFAEKYISAGVGIQAYDFHATVTTFQYIPAAYGEVRFNIRPQKRNQFFVFADMGIDFYTHNLHYWRNGDQFYRVHTNNGLYYSSGFGYFRRVTVRGWGPYVSLKMISNEYKVDKYSNGTWNKKSGLFGDATVVVALGFKF